MGLRGFLDHVCWWCLSLLNRAITPSLLTCSRLCPRHKGTRDSALQGLQAVREMGRWVWARLGRSGPAPGVAALGKRLIDPDQPNRTQGCLGKGLFN